MRVRKWRYTLLSLPILFHIFLQFHFIFGDNGAVDKYFENSRRKGELGSDPDSHSDSIEFESVVVENSTIAPNITTGLKDISRLTIYPTLGEPLLGIVFTSLEKEERKVYHYPFNETVLSQWSAFQLQLYAETYEPAENTTNDTYSDPLVVTAYWRGAIKSWKIPVIFINDDIDRNVNRYSDNSVGKTLWQYHLPTEIVHESENLTVQVSNFGEASVIYRLRIIALEDFNVKHNKLIRGTATPTSPAFYKFDIPEGWESVFIHAVSESDICTTMTIEHPRGPFLDMDENQQRIQLTETFTRKTAITLKAENFSQGFLLAFVPFVNNRKCIKGGLDKNASFADNEFRKKEIQFEIRQGQSVNKYLLPTVLPFALFLFIAIGAFIIMFIFHNIRHNKLKENSNSVIERCLSQFTSKITITDLIVTEPSRVVDQSRRYCTAGFVTSAFYSVPVFQLIFTFSRQLTDTGNFDLCYFNHFCSHMLWMFHDFNHMYSNIWYILFGLLYMGMVRIRQLAFDVGYTTEDESSQNKKKILKIFHRADGRLHRGVMTNYGLLYCMGYALIMTGVMSAAYHICPNQRNFQFDTVFMYTIAAITVVTLYQARHPTYLSANFTFTALALVTVITVLGLLWEEFYIRVLFSVVHMLFLLLSLPKVFYSGYIRNNDRLVVGWIEVMKILIIKVKDDFKNRRILNIQRDTWIAPNNLAIKIIAGPGRTILPGFLLFINCLAITAMWTILLEQNFATQVLFICVVNGALYMIFYSLLKFFHGECRRILYIQPGFYLTMSFIFWGAAMTFFFDEVSTWESSPAESRIKNAECIVFSFYDSHDMWHFLSAAALFFSAMFILTVDDDLVDQPKSTIPVF